MFLSGKHLPAFSIKINDLPPQISKEEMQKLVVRLKAGDRSVINTLVLGNMKIAVYIAGLYRRYAINKEKDLVSEAYLALLKATHKAAEGALTDDNYIRYAAFRIHRACGNFVVVDKLIKIPETSKWRKSLKDEMILPEEDIPNKVNVSPLTQMILDETLENSITTLLQQEIVDLRREGYTQTQISKILNIHRLVVTRELADVKQRFFKDSK